MSKTHGLSTENWYQSYRSMMDRCYRKTAGNYKDYGAKGITVCDEWHDPNSFKEWAMENGYREDLTLDRIDVNGNYEPYNCRWATRKEQANNRGNTVFVEVNGAMYTISELSEITGINRSTLNNRYFRGLRGEKLIMKGDLRKCHA